MEALYDDSIIDSINLNSTTSHSSTSNSSNSGSKQHRHKKHHHNENNHARKSKRLPWNCDVIRDRFTPQPYSVQLVERFLEPTHFKQFENLIIFAQSAPLKQYLIIACLQLIQQQQKQSGKKRTLSLLVTHMGANVSHFVELVSRHTTLKLAGIDKPPTTDSLSFYAGLKNDAQLIIISVSHLLEWHSISPSSSPVNDPDLGLVIFDHVTAAFHMRDSYERIMSELVSANCRVLGLASLDIDSSSDDADSIRGHVDSLKRLFRCDKVETATDLLDTFNIFNGFEPIEVIEVCDEAVSISQIHDFNLKLVKKIKSAFLFFEELIAANADHSTLYIHQLCLRVLNECVYLLNEVGVWCLAKSLLPFICQIDKLAAYIEAEDDEVDDDDEETSNKEEKDKHKIVSLDTAWQQMLTLQSTSTLLRELREMCIKQILHSKSTSHRNASFLTNFTTPKVQRLVQLLKSYKSESFCCLIFVQNKQVATSLNLLLKKLAKEDHHALGFLSPNYIIGGQQQQHQTTTSETTSNSQINENGIESTETTSNSCLKQEEILKKFYSGEINLLICTCEMEKSIESPSFVNLIVRFNCTSNPTQTMSNAIASSSTSSSSFDYFSYIETKSRARSKQAHCHFFVEQSHFAKFFAQLNTFKRIESLLMNNYSQLISFNSPIIPYSSLSNSASNSKLSLENAVFFLNRYCIRLPSDALTQLTPRYDIISDDSSRYKCELRLPINSGMHESVSSAWESSREAAKANAAYAALLELYTRNEINEYLEPITKELFYKLIHRPDGDDIREWSQFNHASSSSNKNPPNQAALFSFTDSCYSSYMSHRPGGNKRKQIYRKKVSSYLDSSQTISAQTPSYLYAIRIDVSLPIHQQQQQSNSESEAPVKAPTTTFGLIASRPLLEIVDFPIYTPNGEEIVHIELVKSNIYFTPNQLKLVKSFHRFVFSNVLRMEGRGAAASPFLSSSNGKPQMGLSNTGCLICSLTPDSSDFDWDLMKSVDGCTDRAFLRPPPYVKRLVEYNEEGFEEESAPPEVEYKFERDRYEDSVVIPFYRANDTTPQFYCVSRVDYSLKPDSSFPTTTASSSKSRSSAYVSFAHYFGYKYNIRISDLDQPLLLVSHPSTRLNLLTPRYMNMKATVLQKSAAAAHPNRATLGGVLVKKQPSIGGVHHSSSQIYLVPELVNVHPLKASVWKRCMCLPSILFRLNSLLLAEELRREIASSTGVGFPWVDNDIKNGGFDRLEFEWDARKELEMSNVPDVEIDLATIEHQKKQQANISNTSKQLESSSSSSCAKSNNQFDSDFGSSESQSDSGWSFEISVWDESCLKELQSNSAANKANSKQPKSASKPPSMFNFASKIPVDFLSNINNPNTNGSSSNGSGWNDTSNSKTLFFDLNEMDLFDDEFYDEDEEIDEPIKPETDEKVEKTVEVQTNSNKDEFDDNESSDNNENSEDETIGDSIEEKERVKFTIDLNTLKADMKRKSAKLLSKLGGGATNASSCSMLKQLVNELDVVEKKTVNPTAAPTQITAATNEVIRFNVDSTPQSISTITVQIDIDSIDPKCFSRVLFRCESKNVELSRKIDELKAKLSSSRNHNSKDLVTIEPKLTVLPLKKKEPIESALKTSMDKTNGVDKPNTSNSSNTPLSLRNTDWSFSFSLDDQSTPNELGPGPAILLQALTLSNAGDGFDLERLETVGDSFLKQAITVYLFFAYPNVNEGKLSFLRSKQVSNYNLYKLGKRKGLQELIVSSKFEPLESWLPPHYYSSSTLNQTGFLSSSQSSNQTKFDKYRDHCVSDKAIADCVEAIIGAYLITSGPQAALQVMSWFGLEVLPRIRCDDAVDASSHQVLVPLPAVTEPPYVHDPNKLTELMIGFEQFEASIGYKFRHPVYLVQAFTHASYTNNTITDCYQRLEFLGDAVLDYVITRYLFEYREHRLTPGELTDLRSSLVNNNIFAYLAVKFDFYKYFKYTSPQIFSIVDSFVQNQKKRNDDFDLEEDFFDFPIDDDDDEDYMGLDDNQTSNSSSTFLTIQSQSNELEELEVPKCLGDIFESVAGAIYLDSNRSLDTVWRVYYGLMKPYIEKFTSKVPKSPIRELLEMEPETVKFEKPERTIDGKIRVTVVVFGKGKFKGVGRNYRIAKNAAAKLALKFLKEQNENE